VHKTTLATNHIFTYQKLSVLLEGKAYLGIKIQFKTVQHFIRSWYHTTCTLSVSL